MVIISVLSKKIAPNLYLVGSFPHMFKLQAMLNRYPYNTDFVGVFDIQ